MKWEIYKIVFTGQNDVLFELIREIVEHTLFHRAYLTISIQSAWDTQCKHVYIRYWLPRVNLFIKLHMAIAGDLRWKRMRKRENSMMGFCLFPHLPSGVQEKYTSNA